GAQFLAIISQHSSSPSRQQEEAPERPTPRQEAMYALFRKGVTVEEAMVQASLARSTVMEYLAGYIRVEKPASIRKWVDETTYHRMAEAARQVGTERLKPIFIALGEKVDYHLIRLVVSHLQSREGDGVSGDR